VRYFDNAPLTCARCQTIADAHTPGQEFTVTVTQADNPATNFTERMTATEITDAWPEFGALLARAVGLSHLVATFENLTRIEIEQT
jgi:hypothetical protein